MTYTLDGFKDMSDEELMDIGDEAMEGEDPAVCVALSQERVGRGLPARVTPDPVS